MTKRLFLILLLAAYDHASLFGQFHTNTRVYELGGVIEGNGADGFVKIDTTMDNAKVDLPSGYRLRSNYITANFNRSTLTNVRYQDFIPFPGKGCMPVFYVADNPPVITRESVSWVAIKEHWSVILFGNSITAIDKNVVDLFARSAVILGTFVGKPLARNVLQEVLGRAVMVISNLHNQEMLGSNSGSFVGYILLVEILSRKAAILPLLGNLVLVKNSPAERCDRKGGRRLEILTHAFNGIIPTYPDLIKQPKVIDDEWVSFPEHYGTHVDAPYYLTDKGDPTDQLLRDQYFVPCIGIRQYNISEGKLLGVNIFQEWERKAGQRIPSNAYIFVDTHTNREWPSVMHYLGYDPEKETKREMQSIGIHPDAIRWLIFNRRPIGVGIDTVSIDGSANKKTLPVHQLLAEQNILIMENVADVDRLPSPQKEPHMKPVSTCLLVFLRVKQGTGAPVAIFVHTEGYRPEYLKKLTSKAVHFTSPSILIQLATMVTVLCNIGLLL